MTPEDLRARSALLADLGALFAGVFLAPATPTALAALGDPDSADVLSDLLGEGAREPLQRLQSTPYDPSVREEFFALLGVPGRRYKAPFESVYCDARALDEGTVGGLLLGDSAESVARAYALEGFSVEVRELPDHLGCELAFLGALLARGRPDAASRFAREHLLRWCDAFAQRLATDREARWYPHLAALAAAYVRSVAARDPELVSLRLGPLA